MLGLDLTIAQKIQIGFIALMFALAGYFVYRNTRPMPDMTITVFPVTKTFGNDPTRPISANNPVDQTRTMVITKFGCHDGELEVTEWPNDPDSKPTLAFRPDQRRHQYFFYKNPVEKIKAMGDPVKQALSFAGFYSANGRAGQAFGLLAKCGLTPEQLKAQKEIQGQLLDEVDRIRQSARHGMYEPDLYEEVLRAISAYNQREGDPTKDPAKAALARKVMDLSLDFLSKQEKEESAAIAKFVEGVGALLTADQKSKLVEAVKVAAAPQSPQKRPGRNRAG